MKGKWIPTLSKFKIANKYSFSVLQQNGLVFVDGNENSIDVLNSQDLSLVSSLNTDKKATFSFIMIQNLVFCGLAGKTLQIFEVNQEDKTMKKVKDLNSANIIYSFFQIS